MTQGDIFFDAAMGPDKDRLESGLRARDSPEGSLSTSVPLGRRTLSRAAQRHSALQFFEELSRLVENYAYGSHIMTLLRSSEFFNHYIDATTLGTEERDLLHATIRRLAAVEFGIAKRHRKDLHNAHLPQLGATEWLLNHGMRAMTNLPRYGATEWLLNHLYSRGVLESSYWVAALTKSIAALSEFKFGPYCDAFEATAAMPYLQQLAGTPLEKLNYIRLYKVGLQLDSLIRMWRNFHATNAGTIVNHNLPIFPKDSWEKDRAIDSKSIQTFGAALLSPLTTWNSKLDDKAKNELASAAY
ncbi:uncharacterized protein AB675_2223 [Cyphellophora attinorum]|uniref:Uncharacterized protein n=1 Tax=Cyphellophora attinorum TaxID=1664694 RepID=A0A0N1P125_9EURO|nr:uncharacterized protein AB675_2223 [Phialophora attinorum]KPI43012.1 hypothetical protein AB675_2223 [Phialophora attinorum]